MLRTSRSITPSKTLKPKGLPALLIIMVGLTFSHHAYSARFECKPSTGSNLPYTGISTLRPYNDVNDGDVLGSLSFGTMLECGGGSPGDTFSIHLGLPQGMRRPLGPPNTCYGAWHGIGMRHYDSNGKVIDCVQPTPKVFTAVASNESYSVQFNGSLDYIRSNNTGTPRPPGVYEVTPVLPGPVYGMGVHYRSSINGAPSNTFFVQPKPSTLKLLVSNCTLTRQNTPVDFGNINIIDLSQSTRPFNITLDRCEDNKTASTFNEMMSLHFSSNQLKADGTLSLNQCINCAEGFSIEVSNGNGIPIDLNRKYKLSNGTFTIIGTSIEQHFEAKLIRNNGTPAKAGAINSVLSFIFTSI